MEFDALSNRVIGCVFEVHRELGPGLLESTCERCLAHELLTQGLECRAQVDMPVRYKGVAFDRGRRIDVLVENALIFELKRVDQLLPTHDAQLLSYMKLAGIRTGLLMNFNVERLKDGLKRRVL